MSRQNLSRANQIFYGRASLGPYQGDKPGLEVNLFYRFKPTGNRAATFTGALAAGASSGTLSGNWGGATGLWPITFSDGEVLTGKFLNGNTAVTFYPANVPQVGGGYGGATQGSTANTAVATLVNAVTSAITVGSQPPVVGSANSIALSQAITTAAGCTINGSTAVSGVAVLDVPRNVVAAWTTAAVLTVIGTDFYGQPQTESSASGTTFTGKKAFATITAISVSTNVTGATVGTGNVLGLPYKVISGDVFGSTFNDAADAGTVVLGDITLPATATTGDVRGTYTPAGTLNGSSFLGLLIKPQDPSTQFGSFGVTPA